MGDTPKDQRDEALDHALEKWVEELQPGLYERSVLANLYDTSRAHTLAEARDIFLELANCMEGVLAGDYKPDSFTLQPARQFLGIENDDTIEDYIAAIESKTP